MTSRYVTIRLTIAQAEAASNACDLIADSMRADGKKRDAALYQRASDVLDIKAPIPCGPRRSSPKQRKAA